MSLPRLLSRLSSRTLRFVTIDGRLVTEGVTGRPGAYSHPRFGPVTRVTPHTNHGGALPVAAPAAPWWKSQPELLAAEIEAMNRAFPGFVLASEDPPVWLGDLNTGRGTFEVALVHRADHGLPRVVPSKPGLFQRHEGARTCKSPHLYVNGDLCIACQEDWDPARDDATTAVAWTAHWLAAFTEWRIAGRQWPSEGVVDAG